MSYKLTVTPKDALTIGICLNEPVTFSASKPIGLTDIRDKVKSVADRQWAEVRSACQLRRQKSGEWLGLDARIRKDHS